MAKKTAKKSEVKKVEVDTVEVEKKVEGKFKIVVEANDQVYEVVSDDIAQAILDLNIGVFKTQVIIKVTYGKKTAEKQIFTGQARRLFRNRLMALVFAKNIKLALDVRD